MDIHGFCLQNNQNSFVKNQNLWKLGKFMESIRRMEISWKFTKKFMENDRYLKKFMEIDGNSWKFKEIYGY
jgi:predicted house-cleaning noncanonical NTP pyrophosphatase (MazG superfamily)